MGMKSRASELDREAKKIKSDDSNNIDKVSPRDWVQSTPRTRTVLPRQPIIDLGDLPETTCEQFDYLLQAIGDASPEILYQVNIVDQINAINSDGPFPPSFNLPGSDAAHDCEENRCDKIVATVIPLPYAIGCLAVEVKNPTRYTGDRLCLAYLDERRTGSRFQKRSWQKNYGLTVQSLARKAALSYNREVLGWWVRKIARSETPLRPFKGKEEARRQFLSGDMYVGDLTVRVSGM
ncbi:hypothetical protein FOTG_11226 [Fusarium oxysporum f. sp. vasinfectum 25433]|uniref:Uncharacterized protein n=1 Tax=Fusarium oxysporum f. sp. vasinfectum 25433 TaxID=1089449 RepID=X0L4J7_FUSOX|nr:hypothetical protein FOTG_11226 [Fusarium oxysporum f. sp. vasinfectum 25433]